MNVLITAISGKFPMWQYCVLKNAELADTIIIRLDGNNIDNEKDYVNKLPSNSIVFTSNLKMDKNNWREELINKVHKQGKNFDYVLFPDEDEIIPREAMQLSGDGQFMFDYKMITEGHEVFKYPALPHSKMFKYSKGLTYYPYFHQARIGKDGKRLPEIKTNLKIKHYCFYKKSWAESKMKSIIERYPDYFEKFPT